jgi:hypothetical protein
MNIVKSDFLHKRNKADFKMNNSSMTILSSEIEDPVGK